MPLTTETVCPSVMAHCHHYFVIDIRPVLRCGWHVVAGQEPTGCHSTCAHNAGSVGRGPAARCGLQPSNRAHQQHHCCYRLARKGHCVQAAAAPQSDAQKLLAAAMLGGDSDSESRLQPAGSTQSCSTTSSSGRRLAPPHTPLSFETPDTVGGSQNHSLLMSLTPGGKHAASR